MTMDLQTLFDGTRERAPGCPGGLTLMLLHTGDLQGVEHQAAAAHARGCDRCQAVLDGLAAARTQQLAEDPFDALFPSLEERIEALPARDPDVVADSAVMEWLRYQRGRLRVAWSRQALAYSAAAALAAAALVLAVVQPWRDGAPNPADDGAAAVRVKGAVALDLYALQDGDVIEAEPGVVLRPGDRVQFTYSSGPLDHLIVLGVDGRGTLSRYYPERGADSLAVAPGSRVVLEDSLVLDDAPGPEVFVAVFSDDPLQVVEVERAIQRTLADGDDDPRVLLDWQPPAALDAAVAVTWVEKDLEVLEE
jgi:hypothetical protein